MKNTIAFLLIAILLSSCGFFGSADPTATATELPQPTLAPATDTPFPAEPTATITSTPTNTPEPTEEVVAANVNRFPDYPADGYGPVNFPETINPLTGLTVEDPTILDRRPVSVKISMEPRDIRPQWGVSFADHVYEYYLEGGLVGGRTRLNAIFYGQDTELAGPIRSARFIDETIIRMYKAVFGFGSADYRVLWRLNSSDFYNRMASVSDYPCPPTSTYPLCRTETSTWNHLITDTALLSQHFTEAGIENGKQNLDGLSFNPTIPEGGEEFNTVILRYTAKIYSKWEYDPAAGNYVRYQDAVTDNGNGEEYGVLVDRVTNEPLTADNVVVVLVPQSYYPVKAEMLEYDLTGTGEAFLCRDGMVYEISWSRATDTEMISLIDANGNLVPLKPGNTWYQIMGDNAEATVEEDTALRFTYKLP